MHLLLWHWMICLEVTSLLLSDTYCNQIERILFLALHLCSDFIAALYSSFHVTQMWMASCFFFHKCFSAVQLSVIKCSCLAGMQHRPWLLVRQFFTLSESKEPFLLHQLGHFERVCVYFSLSLSLRCPDVNQSFFSRDWNQFHSSSVSYGRSEYGKIKLRVCILSTPCGLNALTTQHHAHFRPLLCWTRSRWNIWAP